MHISQYGFVCPVGFWNEKYLRVKKKLFLEFFLRKNVFQVFVNNSRILSIWQILFLFLFAGFGIHERFLFLFVHKLSPRIYSYSYSKGKITIRWSLDCTAQYWTVLDLTALNCTTTLLWAPILTIGGSVINRGYRTLSIFYFFVKLGLLLYSFSAYICWQLDQLYI